MIKKNTFSLLLLISGMKSFAQTGPGLLISEVLANPAGTDSPFELIELIATRPIDFSLTPYTVVACNNGTATSQGWIAGGGLSYGFEINTGTVNAGDVVYVGGSSMAVTGTIVRSINTATVAGDGFGAANASGVIGNGGSNGDGIGVFNLPAASITNSTIPVDAIFYGLAVGTALVNGGTDGYQLPVSDLYSGEKLQSTAFLAPDPASAQYLVTTGTFNPVTGFFTATRNWSSTAVFTDGVSGISLSTATPPITVTFSSASQQVNESASTIAVTLNISNPNTAQSVVRLTPQARSNAATGSDFTPAYLDVIIPAGSTTPQTVSFTLNDDANVESDEYLIVECSQLYNAIVGSTPYHYAYIKDNDLMAPTASNEVSFNLLGSYSNGVSGTNSAEIVAHDPTVQRLYIANSLAARVDIVDFSNPSSPSSILNLSVSAYGNVNSVAAYDSIIAVAIENSVNPQDSGKVVFFDYQGNFISQVKVGAMPDMITFNHAGNKVVVACEGEPNNAYTLDPNGSVCVINLSGGVASLNQTNVTFVNFTSFNGQENALRAMGIRIYGPSATASQDFEPEYVTISMNDDTAWVTLQENNAIAEIDLTTNIITQLIPLGTKDWNSGSNMLDASNQSPGINLSQIPVKGMYLPDAIAQIQKNGKTYLMTANEGDARAWGGLNEESRISALNLDATAFPDAAVVKHNHFMGRLMATNQTGDTDNDGDIDEIHVYGARSFSVWDPSNASLVYDNGGEFELITSTDPYFSQMFNASNSAISVKDRSDDKGPEPEGIATGYINGHWYAFMALERIGGCMIYNIDDIQNPYYVSYANNRSVATNLPDRGAEGIVFIPASESPTGNDILILANEISSTLTIFEVNTCFANAGVVVIPSADLTICTGTDTLLTATNMGATTYQWYMNGVSITGATNPTYTATLAGEYYVQINSTTESCWANSAPFDISVQSLPSVVAGANNTTLCQFQNLILTGAGAATYTWDYGMSNGVPVAQNNPGTQTYTVTGTDAFGCSNTDQISITVNPSPSPSLSYGAGVISTGSFTTYQWYLNGNPIAGATSQNYTPTQNGMYSVLVSNASGCSSQSGPFNVTNVDMESQPVTENWVIYPNPFASAFTIAAGSTTGVVRITNLLGETLYSLQVASGSQYHVEADSWPNGMYLVISPDGTTHRILKK